MIYKFKLSNVKNVIETKTKLNINVDTYIQSTRISIRL